MTKMTSSLRAMSAPVNSLLRRAGIFGGAFCGSCVAAVAGYAMMNLLYPMPGGPRPADAAFLAPAPALLPYEIAPVLTHPVAVAPLPAPALPILEVETDRDVATLPPLPDTDSPETVAITAPGALEAVTLAAFEIARPLSRPEVSVLPAVQAVLRPEPRPDVAPQAAPAPELEPQLAAFPFPSANANCGKALTRAIPSRARAAATGSAFFEGLGGLSGTERDNRVIAELAHGNLPEFLRHLEPVKFEGQDARGVATEITICVTPDYLALGSDRDFVRVPLGLPAAASIAGNFDMTLPTPRMVDAIFAQADVRLSPQPMEPGSQMSSTAYFLRHNATIQAQLQGRNGLVAGQKKDVVMAARMANAPGRVAIYGWHRSSGKPIQPVSTVHGATYADYSHGIRLVSKTAFLNGKPVDLGELLASSRYAYLLNSEGPLPAPVIRIASR